MPTYTTTYSLGKPVVGADEDAWGDTLNTSLDAIDDILDGTTPVTGIDINSGTLDGVTIGGTTAGAGTFTNLTATGTTTLAGASTSADITFGDNDKAIFGAGSDLTISHDTTGTVGSYITEAGTGSLNIRGQNIIFANADGSEEYGKFFNGAGVEFNYADATKFATTSTGVDITGTLTSDGLTVDATDTTIKSASGSTLNLERSDTGLDDGDYISGLRFGHIDTSGTPPHGTGIKVIADSTFGGMFMDILNANRNAWDDDLKAIRINGNGDISFYDTSGNAKFFWDASAESLGIGTSSPSFEGGTGTGLEINNSSGNGAHVKLTDAASGSGGTNGFDLYAFNTSGYIENYEAGSIVFRNGGSERMRIDSNGNVGIGTSSPTHKVHISTTDTTPLSVEHSDGSDVYIKLANNADGAGNFLGASSNNLTFWTENAERMRINSSGNVGIGTSSPSTPLHIKDSNGGLVQTIETGDSNSAYTKYINSTTGSGAYTDGLLVGIDTDESATFWQYEASHMKFGTSGTERMRIDSSGNLLVNKTSQGVTSSGSELGLGWVAAARSGDAVAYFNRQTNDGDIAKFYKDGTPVGSIGSNATRIYIASANIGFRFTDVQALPTNGSGASLDNTMDLGSSSYRMDDIYATNGTIQTSDQNEKQDIAELSDAEQRVAVAAKGLLRKFRWKDAVAEKGDEARTHFGIIAQDLQAAFAAEGLDAGDYAMFIHTTWTDEETGEERSRMGVRYSELLAFIIAAI